SVPKLRRSKLNVAEISLQKKYHFFMEQEIFSTSAGLDQILRYYFMKAGEDKLFAVFEQHKEDCKNLIFDLLKLYDIFDPRQLLARFRELIGNERFLALEREIPVMERPAPEVPRFSSDEGQIFHEIYEIEPGLLRTLHLLDEIVIWKKKRKVIRYKNRLLDLLKDRHEAGGRIFFVGSGTSYHASLLGGNFFNNISSCAIIPCNPGLFRSAYLGGLCERDMVVGVTQSGETKDLVDIYNDIRQVFSPEQVPMISIVNNENSTIPQEKSDFFLPILCGPEIAVAATKSFISQVAIFYVLANSLRADEAQVRSRLERVRDLIDLTLQTVEEEVSTVALRLYLKPSLHILGTSLIGLAQEGALKIREVVLNHAQGYDSAEFKHGPNTILGKNTIFSFRDLEHLLSDVAEGMQEAVQTCRDFSDGWEAMTEMLDRVRDFRFRGFPLPEGEGTPADRLYRKFRTKVNAENYFSNYPLFFVCSPDERDRRITITQIHTHKIRGADVVLIAEDDEELRKAVEGRPAGLDKYYAKFIRIPGSSDRNVFVFQAALVLQLLALKMSVAKMKYLNSVHIENHGVHPDVPKNVSKSITVD
ncbi:MAG TPA: SIS domain-containing protein, partial [Candidatus Aminicenantes bacterium]|nr:SIS domain-containing protein [Candidatus Aminicenantes bacterium]